MRRPSRAVWWWASTAAVALATALFVASDLATLHRRAATLGPETDVVVATRDLPLGGIVRTGDVDVVRRHESQAPPGALADAGAVVGRTVTVPVVTGHAVTDAHLAAPERRGTSAAIPPGMRAVRVPDTELLAPPPGAVVDVIVALEPLLAEQVGTTTITPAVGARVLGEPAGRSARDGASRAGGSTSSVLLLVSSDEAQRLAFAVANGTVTLALGPPEDACCVTSSSASSKG